MDPKIYDCFIFFNELDLLEIRLEELYKEVDYFVIVEADRTFGGTKKEYIFEKNKERYVKYKDKIIYLKVKISKFNFRDRILIKISNSKYLPRFGTNSLGFNFLFMLFGVGKWNVLYNQRNKIFKGIKNAKSDDIIIVSDLDEIPNKKLFKKIKDKLNETSYIYLEHKTFFYYLNCLAKDLKWNGSRACKFQTLKKDVKEKIYYIHEKAPKEFFNQIWGIKKRVYKLNNAGWHFTYLGGPKKIYLKSKTGVAEANPRKISKQIIQKDIDEGKFRLNEKDFIKINYVKIDDSFPESVLKNQKKWKHLIKTQPFLKKF